MDLKSGLVVPFYVTVETHGTEGQVLNVEDKVKEVKEDIVRDLGRVVKDPEFFRYTGSKVFTKAQYRMEVIARTEVLRAHNQGRIKFHDQVGVRKLEWMTMEDERVCPICGPLDGKVFDTNRFPQSERVNENETSLFIN